jgi:hypothetical protein
MRRLLAGVARGGKRAHGGDDVVERGTGVEDLGDAGRQQHLLVLGGHDATDDDLDVGQPGGAQRVHQPGHDQVVCGQ